MKAALAWTCRRIAVFCFFSRLLHPLGQLSWSLMPVLFVMVLVRPAWSVANAKMP